MKRHVAEYTKFEDEGDSSDGHYFVFVKDTLNEDFEGYLFNSHPEESVKKKLGIDYLAICKKYPSAYRIHEKYSEVFIKEESDAKKIVDELNNILK